MHITDDQAALILQAITREMQTLDARLRELLNVKAAIQKPAAAPKRVMSAEAKAKIAKAMKRRWKQSRHGLVTPAKA